MKFLRDYYLVKKLHTFALQIFIMNKQAPSKKGNLASKKKADRLNWKPLGTDQVTKLSDAKFVRFYNPYKRLWTNLSLK